MGFGCGRKLLPSCTRASTSASGTIPATAPPPRAYPRSLPIRSSPLHSRTSPHQIRMALPQGGRAHRVCHHHGLGRISLTLTRVRAALTSSAPVLTQSSAAANQGLERQEKGRGAVRTHRQRHQASTNQQATLPGQSSKEELDQGEMPARFASVSLATCSL